MIERAEHTTIAALAQMWVMLGVKHGLDADELCMASGFTSSSIADSHRHIPRLWYEDLRRQVIARLPDVAVGIELGRFASLAQLGYLGLAARYCATPLELLRLVVRMRRFVDSAAEVVGPRLEAFDDRVEWAVPRAPDDPPEAIEAIFVGNILMMRELTGVHLVPAVVRFRQFRSEPLREQLEALFGCPVQFGSDEDCLVFERDHMDCQIQSANPETSRHFEAQVSRILEKQERPFVLVVTRTIEEQLTSGDFSQKRVARRLSLSTRTLQRRLGEQGMRFNELVDEVRKNVACRMLKDPAVPVYSVAFAAGYDDVSSFNRAFKRWTRSSPSAYRGMHIRS